jgi:chemotaxis protein methyltransferase CheR
MGISAVDFEYLRKLMRDHTAIVLDAGKEYIAESRLATLVDDEGFDSIPSLMRELRSTSFTSLHRRVVDAMTNNETWFFRDLAPYQALRQVIVPKMLEARGVERTLRTWSAACSTGQEPYSIAMLLQENFAELRAWNASITATDVAQRVLDRAERGSYSQLEVNRGLPVTLLTKYFRREGLNWVLAEDIRRRVEFKQLNLAEPWPRMPLFDIVFLRNVLIYFDVETKKEILRRVRSQMRPDAFMLLGGAETTLNLSNDFERVQYESTAYYRPR